MEPSIQLVSFGAGVLFSIFVDLVLSIASFFFDKALYYRKKRKELER